MKANDTLRLWTFGKNVKARAFYERHGFRLIRTTNGSGNEEREPDALYERVEADEDSLQPCKTRGLP